MKSIFIDDITFEDLQENFLLLNNICDLSTLKSWEQIELFFTLNNISFSKNTFIILCFLSLFSQQIFTILAHGLYHTSRFDKYLNDNNIIKLIYILFLEKNINFTYNEIQLIGYNLKNELKQPNTIYDFMRYLIKNVPNDILDIEEKIEYFGSPADKIYRNNFMKNILAKKQILFEALFKKNPIKLFDFYDKNKKQLLLNNEGYLFLKWLIKNFSKSTNKNFKNISITLKNELNKNLNTTMFLN